MACRYWLTRYHVAVVVEGGDRRPRRGAPPPPEWRCRPAASAISSTRRLTILPSIDRRGSRAPRGAVCPAPGQSPESSLTGRSGDSRRPGLGRVLGRQQDHLESQAAEPLEVVEGDVLVGAVHLHHAGVRLTVGRPRALRMLASEPPPLGMQLGLEAQGGHGGLAQADHRRAPGEGKGPVLLHQGDVDVHAGLRGARLQGVDHGRRHPGELLLVVAAALALYLAEVGDDVGADSAVDHADVGAGLLVQTAQLHGRDGLGRRLDGAAPSLGLDARVGGPAPEGRLASALLTGGLHRDAAHRARRNRTPRRTGSAGRSRRSAWLRPGPISSETVKNSSYDGKGCARALSSSVACTQGRHGRLVVGAEDGAAAGCGTRRRHPRTARSDRWARRCPDGPQSDDAGLCPSPRTTHHRFPCLRRCARPGVVLVDGRRPRPPSADDRVGHAPLVLERAGDARSNSRKSSVSRSRGSGRHALFRRRHRPRSCIPFPQRRRSRRPRSRGTAGAAWWAGS